jgi:hypothetical protein
MLNGHTMHSSGCQDELQNHGSLSTVLEQYGLLARKTMFEGAFMPPDVARKIAESAQRLSKTIDEGQKRKSEEFRQRAKASGVEDSGTPPTPGSAHHRHESEHPTTAPPGGAPDNPFWR